jgi:hypothetical protein
MVAGCGKKIAQWSEASMTRKREKVNRRRLEESRPIQLRIRQISV